ncbi:MAG: Short-chain dehydrogenase [Acidimicrobiales bacterium]|nr:Short-chain dehydrogenase [Acidimicrobiales bacterium]
MTSYGATTTTDEILAGRDLSGRRYVVTGASSGLGEESTRALAAHGADVTMLARSPEKLEAAADRVRARVPDAQLELGTVDLSSFASIRAFAAGYLADHDAIDVLINNAGVMASPQAQTVDGFELQFGTNHLGHFLLTALLFDAVRAGDAPRVVNLSSAGHSTSNVDLDDINFEAGGYEPWIAYGRSKTANALFSRGLAARYGDAGLLSFAVHPGGIMTDLGRHLTDELIEQMMANSRARAEAHGESEPFSFKSVEAGAATQVWASVADLGAHNGAYLADCQVGVEGGNPNSTGFMSYLLDDAATDRLWTLSEELVNQPFPAP